MLTVVYESGGDVKDQRCRYIFRAHCFQGKFLNASRTVRVHLTRVTSKAGFGPRSATLPGSSKYKALNSGNS